MPLVGAGIRVENDDTVIAIAVGHIEFASGLIDNRIGRRSEILRVVAALIFARTADLHQELAIPSELQNLRVLLPGTGDPDIVPSVDINSMLEIWPFVPFARPAPGSEEIAGCIEFQYGGSRAPSGAGFVRLKSPRPVDDPDVVFAVDGDTGDSADQPFVRQRLRPEGIDLKGGDELLRRDDIVLGVLGQRRFMSRQREQQGTNAQNPLHLVPLAPSIF
jgi:hypothetical protein